MSKYNHNQDFTKTKYSSINKNGNLATINFGQPNTRIYYESYNMSYEDNDQPHNNIPPYKVVYIWERTA